MRKKGRPFSKIDYWSIRSVTDLFRLGYSEKCRDPECNVPLVIWRKRIGWGVTCLLKAIYNEIGKILRSDRIKCYGPYEGRTVPWGLRYLRGVGNRSKGWFGRSVPKHLKKYRYPACDLWIQDSRIIKDLLPAADAAHYIRLGFVPWHCATCWFGIADEESDPMFRRKVQVAGLIVSIWKIGRRIQKDNEEIKLIFGEVPAIGEELRERENEFWEYFFSRALEDRTYKTFH